MGERKRQFGCPACGHLGYYAAWAYDRPEFTCDRCGNRWTSGLTGGVYMARARPTTSDPKDPANA